MTSRTVWSDSIIENCIKEEQVIEIWINGKLQERCLIADFNSDVVKTRQGFFYPRNNITLVKGKQTQIYSFVKR